MGTAAFNPQTAVAIHPLKNQYMPPYCKDFKKVKILSSREYRAQKPPNRFKLSTKQPADMAAQRWFGPWRYKIILTEHEIM